MGQPEREGGHRWRLGLVGAGRFGRFCLNQMRGWPRVQATAVADAAAAPARATAEEYGLACCETPEGLLASEDVDIVLISTPPDTHHALTMAALAAGKHVVCEKPLALTAAAAEEAVAAARRANRLLVANHMLRYSALLEAVQQIVQKGVLGEARHAFFENYAEDERLPADHWFWDRSRSGGIFVEHAVHFFDLHRWWFGPGEVLAAHMEARPGASLVDRVWCETRHGGVLGHQYHQFDQPTRLDRADHRVVFERGQAVVQGWIPMALEVTGIVEQDEQRRLREICREGELEVVEGYEGEQRQGRAGGKPFRVTARVVLTRELTEDRGWTYGEMLRRLLDDQLRSLEDPTHVPRLQAEDARDAVAMAARATDLSAGGGPWPSA